MEATRQMVDVVRVTSILYQAIAAAGEAGIPSGHLYAASMNVFENVGAYEKCIGLLVRSGLVVSNNSVLTVTVKG